MVIPPVPGGITLSSVKQSRTEFKLPLLKGRCWITKLMSRQQPSERRLCSHIKTMENILQQGYEGTPSVMPLHCFLMEKVHWNAYMYVPHLFILSSPNLRGNHSYVGGGLGASLEPDNYRLLAIPQSLTELMLWYSTLWGCGFILCNKVHPQIQTHGLLWCVNVPKLCIFVL